MRVWVRVFCRNKQRPIETQSLNTHTQTIKTHSDEHDYDGHWLDKYWVIISLSQLSFGGFPFRTSPINILDDVKFAWFVKRNKLEKCMFEWWCRRDVIYCACCFATSNFHCVQLWIGLFEKLTTTPFEWMCSFRVVFVPFNHLFRWSNTR